MSSTKSQVAVATNIPNLTSSSSLSLSSASSTALSATATSASLAVSHGATAGSGIITTTTTTIPIMPVTTGNNSAAKDYNNSNNTNNSSNDDQQQQQSSAVSLGRQNSFGNNRRSNMKGKHLTRSHAMRESTSPPRTPTPRSEQHGVNVNATTVTNGQANYQQQQQQSVVIDGNEHNNNNNKNSNNNKLHAQSTVVNSTSGSSGGSNNNNINSNQITNNNIGGIGGGGNNNRGNSPLVDAPSVIVTSQHKQQQQQQHHQQHQNVAPLSNEAEFPKLTPPKKSGGGGGGGGGSGGSSGVSGNKAEFNNNSNSNNNNNSNGKKYPNGNVAVPLETHKHSSGGGGGSGSGGSKHHHQQQQQHYVADVSPSSTPPTTIYNSGMNYQLNTDRQERHDQHQQQHHRQRNESQNSNDASDIAEAHQQHHYERIGGGGGGGAGGGGGGGGGKKHRANTNSKGTKPRLKNIGTNSSGSNDGNGAGGNGGGGGGGAGCQGGILLNNSSSSNNSSNNTSGFISRENSGDQYTDHGGTDLLSFFKETLNRNPKDRHLLMKIEKDLIDFVQEKSRGELRFPSASSYNRMLIHRTAAYFGMEHNVDAETQQCVIVAVTKNTRIPEMRFKSLVRLEHREDSRKSILKRDTHSFDEPRQSTYLCPDRGMLDRKAKSFEEREEDYERARSRIFNRTHPDNNNAEGGMMGNEEGYGSWCSSAEQQQRQARANGKLLKMQNSTESRDGGRSAGGAVPKAHSFGGYGGPPTSGGPSLPRGESNTSNKNGGGASARAGFSKQDSIGSSGTAWRLSPSSSGYKTRTQSVRSDSVTPSPTGYGSDEQTQDQSHLPPQPPLATAATTTITHTPSAATVAALQQNHHHHHHHHQHHNNNNNSYNYNENSRQQQQQVAGIATCLGSPPSSASSSASSPPASLRELVWAVTDITNVPIGSVLINPRTLQPIVNRDGSIYHFDPSNLPPPQALPSGVYQQQQQQQQQQTTQSSSQQQTQSGGNCNSNGTNNTSNYTSYRKGCGSGNNMPTTGSSQAPQSVQQHQAPVLQQLYANEAGVMSSSSTESYSDEACNAPECIGYEEYVAATQTGAAGDGINYMPSEQAVHEPSTSKCTNSVGNECDNAATACLSITTTSTKNYDRIEVQKFKHQATSPNIPCDKDELAMQDHVATCEDVATPEQPHSLTPVGQVLPQLQQQQQTQQSCEPSHSSSSTPYSNSEVSTKQVPEEPKTQAWTYTQSYQAPDGSTVFHTTAAPNGGPYCATYQQAPDGSIYAVPQGMIYAYPQSTEGEMQGYLMPIFDHNQQRNDAAAAAAAAGLIPAGAQAIYQTPNGPAAVMPVATATYPAAQFATAANGAPIYQGPVIYSSDQFAPPASGPHSAQLQQIPAMATYPIGYPYPYNGYWGQTMTYYVPAQQAVTATPLVSAAQAGVPPQASQPSQQALPPHQSAQGATLIHSGPAAAIQSQIAGGMQLTSITQAAAGPQSNNAVGNGLTSHHANAVGGTTYYGTGRVKRTPGGGSIHYSSTTYQQTASSAVNAHHHHAAASHPQQHHAPTAQLIAATIPGNGTGGAAGTTTYHAVQTIALATGPTPNVAGGPNTDLNAAANGGAPVYALQAPHAAALLPSNVFPYAAAAAPGPVVPPPVPASNTTATVAAVVAPTQTQQQNSVITAAPFYPASTNSALIESQAATNSNVFINQGATSSNNASQSAPSTPHSLNTHPGNGNGGMSNGRQPPLFSTPPIASSSSAGNGSGGYHSNSSTPHCFQGNHGSNEQPQSNFTSNSPYDKRNNGTVPNRKPHNFNISRQNSNGSGYNGGSGVKTPLLNSNNEPTPRASPNSVNSGGFHAAHRSHPLSKRNGDKPQQPPLISGQPPQAHVVYAGSSYQPNTTPSPHQPTEGKPPVRLNAAAATFRHKPTSNFEFRRSASQRNSPGINGTSSNESNNNSPNSIVTGGMNSASSANTITPTAVGNNGPLATASGPHVSTTAPPAGVAATAYAVVEPQPASHQASTSAASLYIASRGTHIPPQMQHAGPGSAGQHQATAATMLGGAAVAAALGTYNPGAASGVYFKYGQTYFAHPSVALPNSRRSPSTTDLRPPMAQMAGIYPTAMMIQAAPRHAPSRHPNPNYKGTRPR